MCHEETRRDTKRHEETHALRQTKVEPRLPKATACCSRGGSDGAPEAIWPRRGRPESDPGRALGRAHPLAKPLEAHDLALHPELDGRAARCGHQGGDPLAISGDVAVDEHGGPGAARAHQIGPRADALVHRLGLGEIAVGLVPAPQAGGQQAAWKRKRPITDNPDAGDAYLAGDLPELRIEMSGERLVAQIARDLGET